MLSALLIVRADPCHLNNVTLPPDPPSRKIQIRSNNGEGKSDFHFFVSDTYFYACACC